MSKIKHGYITNVEAKSVLSDSEKALKKMKKLEKERLQYMSIGHIGSAEIASTRPIEKSKLFNYLKSQNGTKRISKKSTVDSNI